MRSKKNEVLIDMTALERPIWGRGQVIAGMDEAGRGPLAGPVAAACVIMPETPIINGINDSKLLTERRRETLRHKIISTAIAYNIALIDVDYINENGIQPATLAAFRRAYEGLDRKADCVFADYVTGLQLPNDLRIYKGGDRLSYSIAAASIMAKTERDAYMLKMHERYPEYGFNTNKGYGTLLHIAAIDAFGKCPLHRDVFVDSAMKKYRSSSRELSKRDLGYLGERHAERYLKERGLITLERNFRAERSEIDLIMRDGDTIVFVEVKMRSSDAFGMGADAVNQAKQRTLIRGALAYAQKSSIKDKSMRFDVVEVSDSFIKPKIRYIPAAFSMEI